MYGIEVLLEEHKNILKFTDVMEKICIGIMNGDDINQNLFKKSVSFIKEYADKHHHRKEENILFKHMIDNLDKKAEVLVKNGMMVEHDLGRLKVMELEKSLKSFNAKKNDQDKISIITNTMSYVYLIRRHIDKEDRVVYTFAENNLPENILEEINEETKKLEKESKANNDIKVHLDFLNTLIEKYL